LKKYPKAPRGFSIVPTRDLITVLAFANYQLSLVEAALDNVHEFVFKTRPGKVERT